MRIPARQFRLASVAALFAILTGCGHSATKLAIDDRTPVTTATSTTMTTTTTIDKAGLGRYLAGVARSELGAYLAGVESAHLAQTVHDAQRQAAKLNAEITKAAQVITRWPPSFQPCTEGQRAGWVPHGTYPPCWRVATESGGDYNAYNPGGCGGGGCFGKWQFSAEWAGKLGLPTDLRYATPAQQDAAAATLWAGGRGCLNWDAC